MEELSFSQASESFVGLSEAADKAWLKITSVSEDDPQVTEHLFTETWNHVRELGRGAFGAVHLEQRLVTEKFPKPALRAVKHLLKPRGQMNLSEELMGELNKYLIFKDPEVRSTPATYVSYLAYIQPGLLGQMTDTCFVSHSCRTLLSRP